jgi:5'-nucleotidase
VNILVTNDDGIQAPGLLALAQEMRKLGSVTVFAPDRNWSASGHVKTMERPLRVRETILADGTTAFTSDGAPSDCVAIPLLGFLKEKIDLVVSGINPFANIGHDVTYSGTVTAAMEAVIAGVTGVAVSLDSPEGPADPLDYAPSAAVARRVVEKVITDGIPQGVIVNVNVPYLKENEIKGFTITRQGCGSITMRWIRAWTRAGNPTIGSVGKCPAVWMSPAQITARCAPDMCRLHPYNWT